MSNLKRYTILGIAAIVFLIMASTIVSGFTVSEKEQDYIRLGELQTIQTQSHNQAEAARKVIEQSKKVIEQSKKDWGKTEKEIIELKKKLGFM